MLSAFELGIEFFEGLLAVDQVILARAAAERCRDCGGPLHRGDYPRKPRGGTRPAWPAVDVSPGRVQGAGPRGCHRSGNRASSCSSVVASRIRGRTSVRYSVGSTLFAMQEPTSE